MKAAIIPGAGQNPVYGEFREPVAADGEHRIEVTAAALSHVVKSRASGGHYSASHGFPLVAGVDGVGRLQDGRRVYFILPHTPFGSMAEIAAVPQAQCAAIPDGVDDITAAAIANPGLSSWTAFNERAHLAAGETVLVNGATGMSGRLAVQIAKYLGARKVIATGRNAAVLQSLKELGADVTIQLVDDREMLHDQFREQFENGVDVVLDYLWGPSAACLLDARTHAGNAASRTRFVQIGAIGGATISLPAATLRATAIELMGSGLGSVAVDRIAVTVGELLQTMAKCRFPLETKAVPLSDVAEAWPNATYTPRIVFMTGRHHR
jgi:NADPH:quinone reductase-like Zn-dependent oxidoreductase